MKLPRLTLLDGRNDRAELDEPYRFDTPIKGYFACISDGYTRKDDCTLEKNGVLVIDAGFKWDFGSGPAVDTPDMVIASLAHDALCRLTDRRLVPWKVRPQADKYFRRLLKLNGCSWLRRWYAYIAVRAYSYGIARGRTKDGRSGLPVPKLGK